MKIGLFTSVYFNNIGNGFIDLGAEATLKAAMPEGAEIIKFSAPMCYECIELEKVFKEVYPNYSNKVTLQKIDTTKKSNQNNSLIKQYEVKLVPTTIFKNSEGQVVRRIEGSMQPRILENYIKEIIND